MDLFRYPNFKQLLLGSIFTFGFLLVTTPVSAETYSYRVTDAIPTQTVTTPGQTFFETDLNINYTEGEIVISNRIYENGQSHWVNDAMFITVVHSDGSTEFFDYVYNLGCLIQPMSAEPVLGAASAEDDEEPVPWDITRLFNQGNNQVNIRFNHLCSQELYSTDIYLVNTNGPDDLIPPPEPFLIIPWDYESKDLTFTEAIYDINSYFDHTYPLLSTSLSEPTDFDNQVTTYKGLSNSDLSYTRHDGYDWGRLAGAGNGEELKAAATGCAYYAYGNATGNSIRIDHGNGFQTRYYHMQTEGLVTTETDASKCIQVIQGDTLGQVGSTGNSTGPHLHFMVIKDKNNDGDFEDNIPDGIVDPFGWQSNEADPWAEYQFSYKGKDRTGAASYYLWLDETAQKELLVDENGITTDLEGFTISFPEDNTNEPLVIYLEAGPSSFINDYFRSIGITLDIKAQTQGGQLVTTFDKPIDIIIDYSKYDLSAYDTSTLRIYSTTDGGLTWQPEETIINWETYKAMTSVDHLTAFGLFAERRDTTPPETEITLEGQSNQTGWYSSDVTVILMAEDNPGGLGIDYTLIKVDDGEWQDYTGPAALSMYLESGDVPSGTSFNDGAQASDTSLAGEHTIQYYSVDLDENLEEVKTTTLNIDQTPPEAKLTFNPQTLKTEVTGIDDNGEVEVQINKGRRDKIEIILTDISGNTLRLNGWLFELGKSTIYVISSLQYNQDQVINLDQYRYHTRYAINKDKQILRLWQAIDSGSRYWGMIYFQHADQTIIYSYEKGQEITKETKPGLALAETTTNQGKIEVSY